MGCSIVTSWDKNIRPCLELEARRRLAVARVNEGWKHADVAAFLGVSIRAVGKWMAAYRASGDDGLDGKPHPGPKPKLSKRQERGVLSCLAGSPKAFGYATDLWTIRRLAEVIAKRYGVRFNSNYLPHLDRVVRSHLGELGKRPDPIRSLWRGGELPFIDKNEAN